MVKEGYQIDIYKIDTKDKLDKRKILTLIFIILSIFCIILSAIVIEKSIKRNKIYNQYVAQIQEIKRQEEEKQKQIAEEAERKRQEKLPKLTEVGRQNIENIYHSDTKRAFLTFDDGPSAVTPRILDTLKQENIKATFFVLGSKVKNNPELTKRIYNEGHFIAIHGTSHVYSQIYSSEQAVLDEYNQCLEEIRNALGEKEYNPHLFRFPGGSVGGNYADVKQKAKDLLSQNEILTVDWNALNGDAETNNLSSEFELNRLNETISGKNSIVILMHDSPLKSVTADTLPQIISNLRNQGYEFQNFYEIIK